MSAESWAYGPAPKKRGIIRRHKVLAFVLSFVLFASAGALAAWLVDGSGSAYTKAGSLVAPTFNDISGSVQPDPNCLPGNPCDFKASINNPNGNLVLIGVQGVSVQPGPGCNGTDFDLGPNGFPTFNPPIAVPSGTNVVDIPNLITMKPNAPTGCQGTSITFNASAWHFSTP